MMPILELVDKYIEYKQALGFDFIAQAQMLHSFEVFAADTMFDADLALAWSRSGSSRSGSYERARYETIRRFSQFAHSIDPDMPGLPPGLLSRTTNRVVPYIYSTQDITILMRVAEVAWSRDGLKAEAMSFLIGFMAATGLRVSEAVGLGDENVDIDRRLVNVVASKNDQPRTIPIDDSVAEHIAVHQARRDELNSKRPPARLIVGTGGRPLSADAADQAFAEIRWALLDRGESFTGRKPRLHDLRHTFATATILRWRSQGADVNAMIPYLSVYLGHKNISETYWYLTGVPELLESAAEAFQSVLGADHG